MDHLEVLALQKAEDDLKRELRPDEALKVLLKPEQVLPREIEPERTRQWRLTQLHMRTPLHR